MRIGIDARLYGTKHGGIGRYVENLIGQLEKIDSSNEYFIFLQKNNFDDYNPSPKNFKKVLADFRAYSFGEQILFPLVLNKHQLDLVHFTHFNVPLFYFKKFIVTIHDLIISHYPNSRATTLNPLFYRFKLWVYKIVVKLAAKRARNIIAVSKYTKQDVSRFLSVKPDKITVTHEGVDLPMLSDGSCQAVLDKFGLKGDFLLYVGSAYPHKNLEVLIKAFQVLKAKNSHLSLVLVGSQSYFYTRLATEIDPLGLSNSIILTGYVDDQTLACLYRSAKLYIFPSLIEGFGLPPLEAQSYGLPVVSSNSSCLPEVLGDSAIYFDPNDIDDIVGQTNKVLSDSVLTEDLINRGHQNVKRYSWESCANLTKNLYTK
jgi:glycosyltransferase involved in cell wall biosynthesis